MRKAKPTPLSDALLPVRKGEAAPAPEPGRQRRASTEDRVAMTFRLKADDYEYLRRSAFEARMSQQALLDEAIKLLRNGGSTVARLHASMEG
jgi:hypothetical protein